MNQTNPFRNIWSYLNKIHYNVSTVIQLWKPINTSTLKIEALRSPKHQVEIGLHCVKFQNTSLIDTVVKASQKTVFFEV
jgi:hypothetical protein